MQVPFLQFLEDVFGMAVTFLVALCFQATRVMLTLCSAWEFLCWSSSLWCPPTWVVPRRVGDPVGSVTS